MWIAASATPARTSEARIAPIFVVMSWSALPISPAWTEVSAPTKSIWAKRSSSLPAGAALTPTPVAVMNGPSEAGAAASPASGAAEAGRRPCSDTTTTVSDRTSPMGSMAFDWVTSSSRAGPLGRLAALRSHHAGVVGVGDAVLLHHVRGHADRRVAAERDDRRRRVHPRSLEEHPPRLLERRRLLRHRRGRGDVLADLPEHGDERSLHGLEIAGARPRKLAVAEEPHAGPPCDLVRIVEARRVERRHIDVRVEPAMELRIALGRREREPLRFVAADRRHEALGAATPRVLLEEREERLRDAVPAPLGRHADPAAPAAVGGRPHPAIAHGPLADDLAVALHHDGETVRLRIGPEERPHARWRLPASRVREPVLELDHALEVRVVRHPRHEAGGGPRSEVAPDRRHEGADYRTWPTTSATCAARSAPPGGRAGGPAPNRSSAPPSRRTTASWARAITTPRASRTPRGTRPAGPAPRHGARPCTRTSNPTRTPGGRA